MHLALAGTHLLLFVVTIIIITVITVIITNIVVVNNNVMIIVIFIIFTIIVIDFRLAGVTWPHLLLKVAAAAVRVVALFEATSESKRASSPPGRNLVAVEGSTRVVAGTGELFASHAGSIAL